MCCRTPHVIARRVATKQSIFPRAEPWIVSRSLSSGGHSPDPLARNDGARGLGHLYCFRCRCAPTAAPRPSQSPHRQSTTITTVSCAAISVSSAGAVCAQGWWPTLDLDQRNPSPQAGMLFSASFLRGVWRQPLGLPRYVAGYEFTQHPRENDQPRENDHETCNHSTSFCVRALKHVRTCMPSSL